MTFIKFYVIAFVVFFLIDMLWLGVIAKSLYQKEIGHLMASQFRVIPALLFYLIYIGGLVFFTIYPSVDSGSIKIAIMYGALFGLVSYATYDLTNLATLKGWPVKIVIFDLLWGTFISATTAGISLWIGSYWKSL
jgi:uncharacterized membrane protein